MGLLAESSELSILSLLRAAISDEPIDPVLVWRERFQALVCPQAQQLLKAVCLEQVHLCMQDVLPQGQLGQPGWLEYHDVLWIRSSGALYDGQSGLALPGTYLTRFPRQRQTPHCNTFRVELTNPVSAYPRLEQAMYLPFAICSNFGHFVTETLAFLWPLLESDRSRLQGQAVLLTGCRSEDANARILHGLVREARAFPLLDDQLPEALHLERVSVPDPSLRLHVAVSATHLHAARKLGDWLLASEPVAQDLPKGTRLFISRSLLKGEVRSVDQEAALEALLAERGWIVFHPEQHPLSEQVAIYRAAHLIAGFEGSALHGLVFLGVTKAAPHVILLGDAHTSPDYFLQLRAQGMPGFFIQCLELDPAGDGLPIHLRPRLLQTSPESLVGLLESLAAAA